MHSPFDLLALLLVISAGLAYLNHRALKLPLTVGLLVGAAAGTLLLIALDAVVPGLGLKLAIRGLVASINFPATLLDGFLAFLLFAGALQVNSADMLDKNEELEPFAMLRDLQSAHRDRVSDVIRYPSVGRLMEVLDTEIIAWAQAKFADLLARKAAELRVRDI